MTTILASGPCMTVLAPGHSELLIFSREVTADDIEDRIKSVQADLDADRLILHRDPDALVALSFLNKLRRKLIKPLTSFVVVFFSKRSKNRK